MAALVTVIDAILAFPIAYYMARTAAPAHARRAVHARAAAAVVELPRPGVRVARDPRPGRAARMGVRADRDPGRRSCYPSDIADPDRVQLHLAAVHDPADLRRASSGSRRRSSRRPATSARGLARPSAGWSCRSPSRPSWRARSSRSRSRSATTSPRAGLEQPVHRQRDLREPGGRRQHPVRGRVRDDPGRWSWRCTCSWRAGSARSTPCERAGRWAARWSASRRSRVLVFLYVPIVIIVLYAFNADRAQTWPITNWTTHWFGDAFNNEAIREALLLSVEVALGGDGPRAAAGLAGGARRPPVPVLRPRDGVVPARAAARAARHRDRHGAERHLQHGRHPVQLHHDRRRPRDVLRRRRLQQRHRAPPSLVAVDRGGVDGPRRRHAGRRSATSRCRSCGRRSSPAACSRSPCRSTR